MGISSRSESASQAAPPFGLVVTHQDIGRELLKAVESIAGPQENLQVLSNRDAGLDTLRQQIQSAIPPDRDAIIMVDYFGGSAHLAARASCQATDRQVFVCGVNLPMLLSFVTKRNQLTFSELTEVIKTDAIRGIR